MLQLQIPQAATKIKGPIYFKMWCNPPMHFLNKKKKLSQRAGKDFTHCELPG